MCVSGIPLLQSYRNRKQPCSRSCRHRCGLPVSPPATGKPEQTDGCTGRADSQAVALSWLLLVQAAAPGVLQPGLQILALPPRSCRSLGKASPVPPTCSSSGTQASRPGCRLPLGTEAPVQPQEKASFLLNVQCPRPPPDCWPQVGFGFGNSPHLLLPPLSSHSLPASDLVLDRTPRLSVCLTLLPPPCQVPGIWS